MAIMNFGPDMRFDIVDVDGVAGGFNDGLDNNSDGEVDNDTEEDAVPLPLIAAGGIGSGRAMMAAMALGADGVQIGSLFAASKESSAHENFKNSIVFIFLLRIFYLNKFITKLVLYFL